MSSQEPTDEELDNIFNDVSEVAPPRTPPVASNVSQAAQQIAQQMIHQPPQTTVPMSPAHQHQMIAPPPSVPVMTQEQKEMDKYNVEKRKLFEVEKQLFEVAHSDKSGSIIRNFGLSQIVIKVGDEIDRINGLVSLRSLQARCKKLKISKGADGKQTASEVSNYEELADCMYEVWGVMEDGSLGLTSSYSPSMILCVISLRSGYDLPPEA